MFHAIALLCLNSTLAVNECKPNTPPKLGSIVPAFSSNLRTMFQDRTGAYWFGSDGEGVSCYDGMTITRYTTKDGLPSDLVIQIQEDKKGNLYFATYSGVAKYDGKTMTTLKPVVMDAPDKGWRLDPNDLWFVYGSKDGGPSRYDGKTLYSLRFPKHHLEDEKLVKLPVSSMYSVYTIYKDKKGNLWFGTADVGLCRYDGKTINWLYENHLTNVPGAGSFGIRSIIEDRDGKLWICNTKNRYVVSPTNKPAHGLLEYNAERGVFDANPMLGNGDLYFQSVAKGKEGDLWMMPWGGGIFRWDGRKLSHYQVGEKGDDVRMSQIYKDRSGDLWIASQTGGPYKFDGKRFVRFVPKMG